MNSYYNSDYETKFVLCNLEKVLSNGLTFEVDINKYTEACRVLSELYLKEKKYVRVNEILEEIKNAQKKLSSLLKVFSNHMPVEERINFSIIGSSELMPNLGKIMIGQGTKYFTADYNDLLDFSAFFNLLVDSK